MKDIKSAEEIVNHSIPASYLGKYGMIKSTIIKIMKSYGRDCARSVLIDAANNAEVQLENNAGIDMYCVDKQSILDTEIKTP